ncbi:class I SAM-dependent methyltransferase [Mobilicoccus caccae]|uniref:Trans-aconitate methyltransferase n=1 Tax=Mobilicoccus caccae TaxID=1859295 RepID=A0ABQ6IMK6_9MICO|nr:class I SAM-dependent methyltransferase [Mobilicoccus caccae]GMA38341.1 trans-aconitate methyltransferase [Mobilicoccus caccae]
MSHHEPSALPRPIAADWLTLRRPADEAAREGTQRLGSRLWRALQERPEARPGRPVHVIDLGAGTGANQAWLAQRLPFPTRWTLLDHDPDLLHHPETAAQGNRVHGGIEDLPDLLTDADGTTVLTCSALLDLLTPAQLDDLARVIVDRSVPALFSLTVDGTVTLAPADEDDETIGAAFEAHQQREDIAGSTAAAHLAGRLREAGAEVVEAATPWRLTTSDADLIERYLTDRVAAAVEQEPTLAERGRRWLERRLDQCREGRLAVVVGHVDLLVLPR